MNWAPIWKGALASGVAILVWTLAILFTSFRPHVLVSQLFGGFVTLAALAWFHRR